MIPLTGLAFYVTLHATKSSFEEPNTSSFLQQFVSLLFRVLEFAVLIRVVLSWLAPAQQYGNPIYTFIHQVTEPILAPLRRFTTFGMIDFSPVVALIGLQMLESLFMRLIAGMP